MDNDHISSSRFPATIDGVEAWVVTPCQCFGDYILRFKQGTDTLAELTLHHRQFIRLRVADHNEDFDLIPASGDAVQTFLERLKTSRRGVPGSRLISLAVLVPWPKDRLDERRALIAALNAENLDPRTYYADRNPRIENGKIKYELWHESALKNLESGVLGDPTGRCRTAIYDPQSRRVVSLHLWK